jgi:hypothetical protein
LIRAAEKFISYPKGRRYGDRINEQGVGENTSILRSEGGSELRVGKTYIGVLHDLYF